MKLILFDIDGTLTEPMQRIGDSMKDALRGLKERGYHIGVVGGSDRTKALYQLGTDTLDDLMDHAFSENGTVYYRQGVLVHQEHLEDFLDRETVLELKRFLLKAIAESSSPIMTGTFIEQRSSMINCSPCGRACGPDERAAFADWDKRHECRRDLVAAIRRAFPNLPLEIAVGGQISIDLYPRGLNKTRCLQHVANLYEDVHFIGDRTEEGGNDHEIYMDDRVVGHRTIGPQQTIDMIINHF